jgi:hypothetical protein
MRKSFLLLLLLSLVSASVLLSAATCAQESGITLDLNQSHMIRIPHLNIGSNWTYAYAQIPLTTRNQSTNGSFISVSDRPVQICIEEFHASRYLSPASVENHTNCLNLTNGSDFSLPGLRPNIFTLSAIDANSSEELSSQQLLVTREKLSLLYPNNASAGDPLNLQASITGSSNQSLIFAALLLNRDDYDNISLNLTSSQNGAGYNSTLKLGDKEQQLPDLTRLSSSLAMSLMFLLPSNSAVAMQDTNQSEVELILLTDPTWPRGEYILTAAAYSQTQGLLDLKQGTIMVE